MERQNQRGRCSQRDAHDSRFCGSPVPAVNGSPPAVRLSFEILIFRVFVALHREERSHLEAWSLLSSHPDGVFVAIVV